MKVAPATRAPKKLASSSMAPSKFALVASVLCNVAIFICEPLKRVRLQHALLKIALFIKASSKFASLALTPMKEASVSLACWKSILYKLKQPK